MKLATTKKKPIHVNVDENLKEEAEQLFDDLGLNMTSAITIFLKQSINEQAIPFMINKGNKETLQALKDIKEGNVHGGFSSVEDLMEDLNA
ncbi:addiction module antitoxin, RelB/DinJ family [Enterococcus faecalis LA3B-2]|nr:addiction module antitoxin, RelB/DinJ family [Enterococcus faecalis LA3B-2]